MPARIEAMRCGPCSSRALATIATSAPASSNFVASAPSCTPVVAASEHEMKPRRMPIQWSGRRDSAELDS